MTHRTDRIWLPSDVARCEPEHECSHRHTCARYLAALPAFGGSMKGFGMPPQWTELCWDYIAVSSTRASAAAPEPREVKRAPRGIA